MIIDLIRRPDLLKASVVHHSDRIRHVDGFFLIMGDIDKGDPQLLLQALQLVLHGTPQLQIQRTKGFVQKKHLRIIHKRSGYGYSLTLTAGKL